MLFIGAIEIVAGLIVITKPKIGAWTRIRLALGNHYQSGVVSRLLRHRLARFWSVFGRACIGSTERGLRLKIARHEGDSSQENSPSFSRLASPQWGRSRWMSHLYRRPEDAKHKHNCTNTQAVHE